MPLSYRLKEAGATVLQGGRFLNIAGDADKGRRHAAVARSLSAGRRRKSHCETLAIGDSNNDLAMLEQASSALIIKSDTIRFHPKPQRHIAIPVEQLGPDGWVEGVNQWLKNLSKTTTKSNKKRELIMGDFHQNGVITTLHNLSKRSVETMEDELLSFSKTRPMGLILPSLYSELQGDALQGIVEHLKQVPYLSQIVIGLDRADEQQYREALGFSRAAAASPSAVE